jgi:hypothetical protein
MAIILNDALTLLFFSFLAAFQTVVLNRIANKILDSIEHKAKKAKEKLEAKL